MNRAMRAFLRTLMTTKQTVISPIDPATPAGLAFWLKADGTLYQDSGKTTPVAALDDPVGAWIEASGRGATFDPVQATGANRPTWKPASFGSGPAVHFDGTQWLSTAGSVAHGISSSMTTFVVFRVGTVSGYRCLISFANAGNTELFCNGTRLDEYVAADHNFSNLQIGANSPYLATFRKGSNVDSLRLNGKEDPLQVADTNNFINGIITIGSDTNAGGSVSFIGDIAEIICYSVVLSLPNVMGIEKYLANRYPLGLFYS